MRQNDDSGADSAAAVAGRQERAAGRLLDDEGLRGDLTDDEFQPLLDWALAAADSLAASTVHLSEDLAASLLDTGLSDVKEIVRLAGAAIVAHAESAETPYEQGLGDLAARLDSSGLDDAAAALARKRVDRLGARLSTRRDLSRVELAESIVQALSPLAGRIADAAGGATP